MSTSTPRLQLLKPDGTENVNEVTQLNDNYDKIDANINLKVVTSATRPPSPYQGQSIFETDTGRVLYYNGTKWKVISPTVEFDKCTGDVSNSTTALADITGMLGWSLEAGEVYSFEFFMEYSQAASTTNILFQAVYSGTFSDSGIWGLFGETGLTARTTGAKVNADIGTAGTTAAGQRRPGVMNGFIKTTTAGTLKLRFKSDVGGSAVNLFAAGNTVGTWGKLYLVTAKEV
jgi:hypothetical protein